MADLISTPRISSSHLDNFTGQTIRITGKIMQLRGDTAILDSEGNVTLLLNRDAHLTVGYAAEIVGRVNSDLSVRVFKATSLAQEGKKPKKTNFCL